MKSIRRIFLVLFVLSTLGMLILFVFSSSISALPVPLTQEPGTDPAPSTGEPGAVDPSSQNSTVWAGSIITSVTSLVGFIVTTAITWRREKREASLADVERRKLEVELEKSKLELEEMKKAAEKKE